MKIKPAGHQKNLITIVMLTTALVILIASPLAAFAQWTTNGTHISNTNTGNVGVGTTTPAAKLDVFGVTRSHGFNVSGLVGERVFNIYWNNAVANQKVQVYWPANSQVDGIFEITVTGHYWFSNSNGGIKKRIVINGRNIGVINMQQSEVPFRLGFTGNSNTISNIMWDAANSRYYFIVANLDNAQNGISIHVKSITPGPETATADNLNVTSVYTSDATVYPQLFNSFMSGNMGVGTNTPGFKLDVQGGQLNASGGLCINGDCKTAWSQVGGGSSQWLTSGSNIYFNTGSVGIGTASPVYTLDVNGGVNGFRSKISSASASDAIATFENSGGIQAIMRGNGNLGLGALNPAVRLAVNGNGANVYNTDAWIENNIHVQGNETLTQGGRGRLRVGTAWGYAGLYTDTSSTSVQNDLVLGAGSGNVRVGPGAASAQNFVVPNGNVGIGTATPISSRLHLYSPANTYQRIEAPFANQSALTFDDSTNGQDIMLYRPANTRNFSVWTATAANVLTVTQPGNVGIGTTTPGTKLDIGAGAAPRGAHSDLLIGAGGNNPQIEFYGPTKSSAISHDEAGGGLVFYTNGPAFSPNFFVSNNGNVGVNTTGPGYKFDVQGGQINSSGGLCIAGDCKTAWSQVGGSSQWTTAGSIIHYNTGNVGIGTAAPAFDANPGAKYLTVTAGTNAIGSIGAGTGTGSLGTAVGQVAFVNTSLGTAEKRLATIVGSTDAAINSGVLDFWTASGGAFSTPRMRITSGGTVGIGTTTPNLAYKLDVNGNTNVTGDINVTGNINAKYQDVAEWVPAIHALAPGTVVTLSLTRSNHVQASSKSYDTSVAGVISERPGIALGERGENKVLVATTGRVRIKVDATNGPIRIGDLLVTSDREGFAMKSEVVDIGGVRIHRPGTLIGKALEPLDKGTGEILVLLSLQ